MRKVAIIQARLGSTRFPGKVLATIQGEAMLTRVIEKVMESTGIDLVVVATTDTPADQKVVQFCHDRKINCYVGNEEDVLARYYEAAKQFNADVVIRVTADCPLFDATVLDEGITKFLDGGYDYVTNVLPPTFPDGLDFSIIRFSVLEAAFHEATLSSEREHVVPWIWKNCNLEAGTRFKAANISISGDYSKMRWTVDYPQDLEPIEQVYRHFGAQKFSWIEAARYMNDHPELFKADQVWSRDEGYLKSLVNDREVKK